MLHRFRPWIFLPWQIPFCHRFDNGFCPVKTTDLKSKRLHTIIDLHHLSLQHRTRKTHSIIYTESKHMIAHPWRVLCAVGGIYITTYYILYTCLILPIIYVYIYIYVSCIPLLSIYATCHMACGSGRYLGWHLSIVGILLHHDLRFAGNGDFARPRNWKMWKYEEGKGALNQSMIWYDLISVDVMSLLCSCWHNKQHEIEPKHDLLDRCWALEFRPSCFVLLILYTILREPRTQHGHALEP